MLWLWLWLRFCMSIITWRGVSRIERSAGLRVSFAPLRDGNAFRVTLKLVNDTQMDALLRTPDDRRQWHTGLAAVVAPYSKA